MKKLIFMLLVLGSNSSFGQRSPSVLTGVNTAFADPTPPRGVRYVTPTTITQTNNPVTTAQWHFAGQQATGTDSWDWVYGLVTTANKETIACGFGNNGAGNHSGTIFKLDHLGNLVWSDAIDPLITTVTACDFTSIGTPEPELTVAHNDLWAITKSNDGGYIAVGRGNGILIVEVDGAGNFINGTPIDVIPPFTPTYGPHLLLLPAPGIV